MTDEEKERIEDESDEESFEEITIEYSLEESYRECRCGAYLATRGGIIKVADCIC